MTLDVRGIFTYVQDHALRSGLFAQVNGHEPKTAPAKELSAATWVSDVVTVPLRSGLASTTARVEMTVRVMISMLHEPQDDIDPLALGAVDALLRAYNGDFDLDGLATVDVLGAYGAPLRAQAGYLTQDSTPYRAYSITLPLIVDDLWGQAA